MNMALIMFGIQFTLIFYMGIYYPYILDIHIDFSVVKPRFIWLATLCMVLGSLT